MTSTRYVRFAILGSGVSGLGTSHHLGHRDAVVFEAKDHYGGHLYSEVRDGFTWDDGPHISFTSNEYVRELFEWCVDGAYEQIDARPVNYFRGHWIDHPAQTHLYQVPQPLRDQCVESFLTVARGPAQPEPKNYQEWLHQTMGPVFADTFPAAYTRKYWTTDPSNLDLEWIGIRVLRPEIDDVVNGAKGPLPTPTYYVTTRDNRYPSSGGFLSYTHKLADGAAIEFGKRMVSANLGARLLRFSDGTEVEYERLVSTVPLPQLIASAEDAPDSVRQAATLLTCTTFLKIDVAANHPAMRPQPWMYVYDEDKLSTRISITENFSPRNAPPGKTGIQVEVYGSEYRALPADHDAAGRTVVGELVEMGLIESPGAVESVTVTYVPTGNPIFDLNRKAAMAEINGFLDRMGVLTAGRYGEWRYLMTDACIISSRRVASECLGVDAEIDASGTTISSAG